jgi:hypothetical protein
MPALTPHSLIQNLSPLHARWITLGWLLFNGDEDDLEPLRVAYKLWPRNLLNKTGEASLLSILLELEELGICEVLGKRADEIEVELKVRSDGSKLG